MPTIYKQKTKRRALAIKPDRAICGFSTLERVKEHIKNRPLLGNPPMEIVAIKVSQLTDKAWGGFVESQGKYFVSSHIVA